MKRDRKGILKAICKCMYMYILYIYIEYIYCIYIIYIYIYMYIDNIFRYICICNHENNVLSRLSPQCLCGNSCTWAHDVRLIIYVNNV